jgi:hypothetical protein
MISSRPSDNRPECEPTPGHEEEIEIPPDYALPPVVRCSMISA